MKSTSLNYLYRGHSNSSYYLLPSLLRKNNKGSSSAQNYKYLTNGTEKEILQLFIQEANNYLSIPSTDLSRWAEYAQHYGVPTRFLDWSSNPLVALFFACCDNEGQDGVVWLLYAKNYEIISCEKEGQKEEKTRRQIIEEIIKGVSKYKYPILYTPYYVDLRMSAQSSYFMVWGENHESFEAMFSDEKYRMKLPEKDTGIRIYETRNEGLYFKFFIKKEHKLPLIRELNTVGINDKTLFPGLDGIGRFVERSYRFDLQEAYNYF